jgi:hypothetical protein
MTSKAQLPDIADIVAPFAHAAPLYRAAGWLGTLPLPRGQKNTPPKDYTGKTAPYPTPATVAEWCDHHGDGNICLRLAGVDSDYEVIGVDVDDYLKGGKKKSGGSQLKAIEQETDCELPPTWVSTSRTDGSSGKRFYRVPRGLRFRGKAADDIEILQKRHRFAVVWPSYNPDSQAVEMWFRPGAPLTEDGKALWDGVIPDARSLPLLPDQIYEWTYENLGVDQPMRYRMREKLNRHVRLIRDEATSHDKLTNAHMNIFHLGREGHQGWDSAVLTMEKVFTQVCAERDTGPKNCGAKSSEAE